MVKSYKIKVNSLIIEEVHHLLMKLGYVPYKELEFYKEVETRAFYAEPDRYFGFFSTDGKKCRPVIEYDSDEGMGFYDSCENIEITLGQLREMVKFKC